MVISKSYKKGKVKIGPFSSFNKTAENLIMGGKAYFESFVKCDWVGTL